MDKIQPFSFNKIRADKSRSQAETSSRQRSPARIDLTDSSPIQPPKINQQNHNRSQSPSPRIKYAGGVKSTFGRYIGLFLKQNTFTRYLFITTVMLIIIIIASAVVYWLGMPPTDKNDQNRLRAFIERTALVPPGENPTIAEIVDIEKLRAENSNLFGNAENGDVLVIYSSYAVLYRPSATKLVGVFPIER